MVRMMIRLMAGLLVIMAGPTLPSQKEQLEQKAVYTCPMHPEVESGAPGECPKCRMALRVARPDDRAPRAQETALSDRHEGRVDNLRIPDTAVYDQDGHRLRFYSDLVQGKTVAINFIFTTCTTICPPLTATFRKVQQGLGDRIGKDVALISVSVDPAVDIPERLKSFAQKFHAGPGWTFVTGTQGDIDKLLAALGATTANKNDHTPTILVGNDPTRYWTRAYGLAPAAKLVKMISEAAGGQ